MIVWETDIAKALARGAAQQKCVLLYFYSPECVGCRQMEEVSFPALELSNFVFDRMVPLRAPVGSKTLASEFRVVWTPTLVLLDYYGKEHQRTTGYLPPDDLGASLLLGIGKTSLDSGQYNEAVIQFNTLLNGYPESGFAPEAVYMRGVARYKSSHAAAALKECYQKLQVEYPGSDWTRRAEPFNLL